MSLPECLNIGLASGGGRYLVRIDDDRLCGPDHLSDTVGYHRSSQADIVFGNPLSAMPENGSCGPAERRAVSGHELPEATLSADRLGSVSYFLQDELDPAGEGWVQRNRAAGRTVLTAGSTSVRVDPDEAAPPVEPTGTPAASDGTPDCGAATIERPESA